MRTVKPRPFPASPRIASAADLGQWIRAARTQMGIAVDETALNLGLAKQTMHNVEMAPERVAWETVLRVARELGVTLLAVPTETLPDVERALSQVPRPSEDRSEVVGG